ncbi:unnamed protein product [Closterium sp. NIES-53]
MASLRVLALDHEGRPVQFDTWLDDLQLDLLSDSKDSVSLFDHVSGAATAPPTTADNATCSQTAQALYDDVVARYSSPATAALGRLLVPYLFPEFSTFATVEDLVSHLRASDARYRAAIPAEFHDKNQPPMFITLYFIVTRLPDSLRSIRNHFLSLDPTSLTVDLLEQHLFAAETSAVAVGAARGTPRPPFFEGCSPSPLAPSYASAAAADVSVAEDVGAASTSAKCRTVKSKGGKGGGSGRGGGGGGSGSNGGGSSGGGGGGGTRGGSGGSGGGRGGSGGSGGGGGNGTGGGGTGARRVGSGGGQRQHQQRRSETQSPQQLREWFLQRGASGGSVSCPYVIRTGDRAGQTCGRLHTQHRCFSRLDDAWCAEFGNDVELPRYVDLLRSRIAIFDLDFDAILSAKYALSVSAEGDCYRCVPPDPGIAAAALGASESGTLLDTSPAQALHNFTLDSSASVCFFHDSTTLTPLSTPVPVRLADPSGGPVVACSSTVLPCPAVPSGSLSGLHFPSYCCPPGCDGHYHHSWGPACDDLHVHTDGASPGHVHSSSKVEHFCGTTTWVTPPCHAFVECTPVFLSLPHLPPFPAPPCLPCIEGRQRAAPHSSSFPSTTASLQTLHMDMWGPVRVSGQSRERYFLLVVDDYTRYTTVYPLRNKGQVVDVLIRWIHTVRLQRLGQDLPVLRLHSNRGVMEVARTSMIHAAAPHFLWPFAVRYAAHQLNLWPRVSLPETSLILRWTGEVGTATVFWVWGSRAFVRNTSADKLSPRAIPCVFLGFVPDAPGWQFYHPTSRGVFPSQDVKLDESVPFYRFFPYRSAPPPPPPLFLAPGPPPVNPLPPQGPAPSGVSQVDPLPGTAPVWVAVDSGAARGAASRGAVSRGAEPGGAESEGAETGDGELGGVETGGGERGGAMPEGVEPGGATLEGAESGGAEPQGAASSGGSAGASPRLSPQQLREWCVQRARLWSRPTKSGGAGVAARVGVNGGTATTGPGGARTRGTRAAGSGGVESAGGGDPTESGACAAGCSGAGGARAGGAGVGGTGAGGAGGAGVGGPGVGVQRSYRASCACARPVLPIRTAHRVLRSCPTPVPGMHAMTVHPSSVPLRVPLPTPPESSLPVSASASALVSELLDIVPACRLDYATALVAESESAIPMSVGGECALGTDVLEDRQEDFECLAAALPCFASMLLAPEGDPDAPDIPTPRSYAEAITGPYSSQWQAAMDAEMASWKSTGTYVDEVPPPGANIVDGMWIFKVKRPSGSPPAFKARDVARGFSQRQGDDCWCNPTVCIRLVVRVRACMCAWNGSRA